MKITLITCNHKIKFLFIQIVIISFVSKNISKCFFNIENTKLLSKFVYEIFLEKFLTNRRFTFDDRFVIALIFKLFMNSFSNDFNRDY